MTKEQRLRKTLDEEIKGEKSRRTKKNRISKKFQSMAAAITKATGSSTAFLLALTTIIIWGITGPIFHYSDTWQLVINTGTTIITFLMVFLIQQSQNKDALAVQLKLNELIAAHEKASNRLIVVEDLTQEELETLKNFYVRLSDLAEQEADLRTSHSVEEAGELHASKLSLRSASLKKKKV